MEITINTMLKKVKTKEKMEVIKVDDRAKTAIVKLESGETRCYSQATLKDKRNFIPVESEVPEVPEPKKLKELREERNKAEAEVLKTTAGVINNIENKEKVSGRKPRITITYNGESKTPGEWAEEFGMDAKKIRLALRKGKTPEEIFNGKNK